MSSFSREIDMQRDLFDMQRDIFDVVEPLNEKGRWQARPVKYYAGRWNVLGDLVPQFTLEDFRVAQDTPANPYMKMVIRLPRTQIEQEIPVGVVSNTYNLLQHTKLADLCFEGIKFAGVDHFSLRCELGLTALGEWMNLRILFPEQFDYIPDDGEPVGLKLECFNSVNGSSRLIILMGWVRFICSNGMIIGKTLIELRDMHTQHLDLGKIPRIIAENLSKTKTDQKRLQNWEKVEVGQLAIHPWINRDVTKHWGKKAACRVFHICTTGYDVEITDPFASGEATEKPVKRLDRVAGAPNRVKNLYDVSQALAYVASRRVDSIQRVDWQMSIPQLIRRLSITI